jgi:hypothetical protein
VSKSTPADLEVAFRSLTRRRLEAIETAEGAPVDGLLGDLDRHIADAAALLGAAPDARAVADAIASRKINDWDAADLDELRRHATEAGIIVGRIAAAGPPAD